MATSPCRCRLATQSGLDIPPGATTTVAANGTAGRYALVYTGMRSEGSMSLRSAEVYTFGEARGQAGACRVPLPAPAPR